MIRNNRGILEDVSARSGDPFQIPRASRGVAFGDIDNDGSVEIAVSVLNGPAMLLKSRPNGNHWLVVNTAGRVSNRDGTGARVRLVSESGAEQFGYVSTTGSYLSASDKRVHFGLGQDKTVRLLEITWPSGIVQRLEKVAADQVVSMREPAH
jgi:hypothetical protein